MNRDLSTALGELADRVERSQRAPGQELPVGRVAARVRHRRRIRAVTVSVASAAAIAVLAVGTAYAVRPPARPAPPAHTPSASSTSATPTPTPTPTPDLVVLPSGDPTLPYGSCGSLADTVPVPAVGERYEAQVRLSEATAQAGDPLAVESWIAVADGGGEGLLSIVPGSGPALTVTRDGVVVATADLYQGHEAEDELYDAWWGENPPTTYVGSIGLTVCDDGHGATSGRPLPAGHYEVRAWGGVTSLGNEPGETYQGRSLDELRALPVAEPLTAVGPAVPFDIVGEAPDATVPEWSTVPFDAGPASPLPACGDPAPAGPTSPAMLSLDLDRFPSTAPAGTELDVAGRLTYAGPDRIRAGLGWWVEYVVVQHGVVVGGVWADQVDGWVQGVDLGRGAGMRLESGAGPLVGCTSDTLPAGDYTVIPLVALTGWTTRPSGTWTGGDLVHAVIGAPFTLTLT
ncbi:hypothetical protein Cch01nite_28840 [Cellulomonas chitinilytica]|uniref:Uncharacterized protein n=1 Tax=Cellulomonas chitinilytica TaxID=398759 RepID=A0A919TZV0_9CELL|nr:hypothetical protein [Cellulomonas chitinilytica]GIG22160.1 hypothetical protein Cch01nite_28840 [Cellulomonas chitinilytica]